MDLADARSLAGRSGGVGFRRGGPRPRRERRADPGGRDLSVEPLLDELASRGVELWLEGSRLRFRGPEGALTAALREKLTARKAEVVAALRERLALCSSVHPVSYNQRSLWFLQQCAPAGAAYNVALAVRICSRVDVPALFDALQALIDRHAVLRTTYRAQDDRLLQVVHGSAVLAAGEVDVSGWADAKIHEEAVRRYREPFDLERGPLLRACLLTRHAGEHILLLSAHHIAVDGWSMGILVDELRALYASRAGNVPALLPRSAVEYTGYTEAQAALLAGPEGERLWAYWQARLAGPLPELRLPADRPRPTLQTFSGGSRTRWLSPELRAAVTQLAKAQGSTPFVLLLAAYFVLLHQCSGQVDLIVGTPTLGRSRAGYRDLVGDCIGMVPLRADLSGDPAFGELVEQVRRIVVGALDHQDYPFPLMVERLALRRDLSRSPVFQTVFVYQKPQRASDLATLSSPGGPRRADFGGLQIEAYWLPQQEGQFDLTMEVAEIGEDLAATLKHNAGLFDAATAERLLARYITLLQAVVEQPAARLSGLPSGDAGRSREQTGEEVVEI